MSTPTPEQRHERALKAGATMHKRSVEWKEELAAQSNDKKRAIEICRTIRDNPDSTDRDKLDAINIIRELTA